MGKEVLLFKTSILWNQKAVYKVFNLHNLLNHISRHVDVLPCKLYYGDRPQCFNGLWNQDPQGFCFLLLGGRGCQQC